MTRETAKFNLQILKVLEHGSDHCRIDRQFTEVSGRRQGNPENNRHSQSAHRGGD